LTSSFASLDRLSPGRTVSARAIGREPCSGTTRRASEYFEGLTRRTIMKPWTRRKQVLSALKNEDVVVGERSLADGTVLRGLYAARDFEADERIASYHGVVVPRVELFDLHKIDHARFERINEYAVGTEDGKGHLFNDHVAEVGAHLINHSCGPNAHWAEFERGSLLVRAVWPIAKGEEITIHYGWLGIKAAIEKKVHRCACQAGYCVGSIELGLEWIEEEVEPGGDRMGGPRLPEEEIVRRLLADICNDTGRHEQLLHRYATEAFQFLGPGARPVSNLDSAVYFERLREGAAVAVHRAIGRARSGRSMSGRRLAQVINGYGVADAFVGSSFGGVS
jgi:hypothetical protein